MTDILSFVYVTIGLAETRLHTSELEQKTVNTHGAASREATWQKRFTASKMHECASRSCSGAKNTTTGRRRRRRRLGEVSALSRVSSAVLTSCRDPRVAQSHDRN